MTSSDLDETSDAEYLARARAGDPDAFAALFARHQPTALRTAARWTTPDRADDLVAEAFARIFGMLRDGRGPTATFRAYLLAAVRSLHVDTLRQDLRHTWLSDLSVLGDLVAVDDGSEGRFRTSTVGRAFRNLPERWQAVLWFTAIEGLPVAEVAELLGMKPHAVSQLSFRAREGLRQQYLAEHLGSIDNDRCARIVDLLPGYVRGGLSGARQARVANHVAGCLRCSTAVAEVAAINKDLGLLLVPVALGTVPALGLPAALAGTGRMLLRGRLAVATAAAGLSAAAVLLVWPGGGRPVGHPAPVRVQDPGAHEALASARAALRRPRPIAPPGRRQAGSPVAAAGPPSASSPITPSPSAGRPPRAFPPTPLLEPAPAPRPLAEDQSLGAATAEHVDPQHPGILHVQFQVLRAVDGAEAVLTVSPAATRYEVHGEHAYGDWACAEHQGSARALVLVCRLVEGSAPARATADLALDLWMSGAGRATLTIGLPGVTDPAPGDNRASVALDPRLS